MEETKQTIHVLMVSFSSQGHINPMLILGKHLQSKGLHVTLATLELLRHLLLKNHHSTTTSAIPSANLTASISGIDIEYFSDGLSLDYDRKSNLGTFMDSLAKFGPINLSNLISKVGPTKKFSCLINTPFLPWVADVAEDQRIPCAMLWIQPCALLAIYHSFSNDLNDFPTKENPEISVKLPGLPLLQACELPSFVLPSNPFQSVQKAISEVLKNVHKFKWVIANSFYELEEKVIDSISSLIPIKPIGPLVPSRTLLGPDCNNDQDLAGNNIWKSDDKCIDWLNQKDPNSVIYVSFGSLVILSREQIEVIGTALRDSKRPFLWVVKSADNPVHEGAGQVPEPFLQETKDQGLVVSWCPQCLVLSHKSIACFITHCGWNSMLESISVGLPVIAYPMWTDQPTNAKLMTEVFGVGLRLWPNEDGLVTSIEIVKCIDDIIDGPRAADIRAKAAEWKRLAQDAVVDGGSSDRNIQEFVHDIKIISQREIFDGINN